MTKICSGYTGNGLQNIAILANNPFRFIYTSSVTVERDQSKYLPFLADYRLMHVCASLPPYSSITIFIDLQVQGRVENAILDFAKKHEPAV